MNFSKWISTRWQPQVRVIFIHLLLLGGCGESYDLGSEAPDEIAVNTTAPTWANGIGTLIQRKCANCHTGNRTSFVPSNTTTSLDSMGVETFYNQSSNLIRMRLIRERITDGSLNPMPPDFATPLSVDELTALRLFIDNQIATFSLN